MLNIQTKTLTKLVAVSPMAKMATDIGDDEISYSRWVKIFSPAKTIEDLEKIDKANKKLHPPKPKGKMGSPRWSAYIEAYNLIYKRLMKPVWANRDKEANKKIEIISKQLSKNLTNTFGAKITVKGKRFTQFNWDEYSPRHKGYCVFVTLVMSVAKTEETLKPASVRKTEQIVKGTVKECGCLVKSVNSIRPYRATYRSKNQSLAVCSSLLVAILVPCK